VVSTSGVQAAGAGSIPRNRFRVSHPGYRGCVRVCWVCVRVCCGVRPQYGVFRDYLDSLVCVESGQRKRSKILHDFLVLLSVLKKIKK